MKIVALFPETQKDNNNQLLSTEKALGLRPFLEEKGHELVIISDTESQLEPHLKDMSVIISSPFFPAYVNEDLIQKAPQLQLAITAGVGSDHVDLDAAINHNISVVEVTGSNVVSVAEHAVMDILILLRNFLEGHRQAVEGEWNLPKVGNHAHDLEGKTVGIFGFGRIGQLVAQRLQPFDVKLQHHDPLHEEQLHGSQSVSFEELVETSDILTIHAPLTKQTEHLFNRELLNKMKRGAYLVNTARGKIVDRDALKEVLESDHLAGYAGDVWYPQPAPSDHPWRTMPKQGMTIHYSGMTLEAQARIEEGVKDILTRFFENRPMQPKDVIVEGGQIASSSYRVK
ncbi:NAD-dependent formate dehydrogenase [Tuberibacillus sp. Marseille-P3662]|uniref:NAD-dependent formate dehydrogenase n=1 Tax=Tuberibacillus sp. Marseille-P3662 TaxID=1965358 RepID=UPI000A1C930A|nr:NAD-dependent formate dehydrogenase [Tuberibacillus sp. Marseille-P3662]